MFLMFKDKMRLLIPKQCCHLPDLEDKQCHDYKNRRKSKL